MSKLVLARARTWGSVCESHERDKAIQTVAKVGQKGPKKRELFNTKIPNEIIGRASRSHLSAVPSTRLHIPFTPSLWEEPPLWYSKNIPKVGRSATHSGHSDKRIPWGKIKCKLFPKTKRTWWPKQWPFCHQGVNTPSSHFSFSVQQFHPVLKSFRVPLETISFFLYVLFYKHFVASFSRQYLPSLSWRYILNLNYFIALYHCIMVCFCFTLLLFIFYFDCVLFQKMACARVIEKFEEAAKSRRGDIIKLAM